MQLLSESAFRFRVFVVRQVGGWDFAITHRGLLSFYFVKKKKILPQCVVGLCVCVCVNVFFPFSDVDASPGEFLSD